MRTIDLLYEDEEGEGMWHDEVRDAESLVLYVLEEFEIHSVATPDDENKILTLIASILEHIGEFTGIHTFSTFIEEDDCSSEFGEGFFDIECFLDLDVLRIGVRYGFYGFEVDGFSEAFSIFIYRFAKVLESICNRENGDHNRGS